MADQLGSFNTASSRTTVRFSFTTHAQTGAAVAPSSAFEAADLRIYKNGSAIQRSSDAGITVTSPFDSVTGLHHVDIDLTDNTDAGFYAAGSSYEVDLVPDETVDSLAVVRVLAYFEIGPPQVNATQFAGQTITAAAGVTLPTTVASQAGVDDLPTNAELATSQAAADDATLAVVAAAHADITSILAAVDTEIGAIKAKTDNLPAVPSAVGSAMTLTSGERDAIAEALFVLANGIESGKNLRQTLRLMAASAVGKRSNVGTATEQYDAIGSPGTARVVGDLNGTGDGTPILTP